jgi:hypothetical protein
MIRTTAPLQSKKHNLIPDVTYAELIVVFDVISSNQSNLLAPAKMYRNSSYNRQQRETRTRMAHKRSVSMQFSIS